jgi:hypothetical protein
VHLRKAVDVRFSYHGVDRNTRAAALGTPSALEALNPSPRQVPGPFHASETLVFSSGGSVDGKDHRVDAVFNQISRLFLAKERPVGRKIDLKIQITCKTDDLTQVRTQQDLAPGKVDLQQALRLQDRERSLDQVRGEPFGLMVMGFADCPYTARSAPEVASPGELDLRDKDRKGSVRIGPQPS